MKQILLFFLLIVVVLTTAVWVRYGGGKPYPDLTTTPAISSDALEEVLSYQEPIGNVAVSAQGRIFFTIHPESRPRGNRLLEYVDGASVPYPNVESQLRLFDTVLGVTVDRYNRLWTIDHGNHGLRQARIIAIDLDSNEIIRDHFLPKEVAPAGSYLQDLQVSVDGETVIISDTSYWRQAPAIVIYDVASGTARRVLQEHDSVSAENYRIRNGDREMAFLGGIATLKGGIDGIVLGPRWLYYAALTGSGLYRIELEELLDTSLTDEQLAEKVQRIGNKPLSGGLTMDVNGNVYLTDVEHSSIFIVGSDRKARTLLRSAQLRWPEALSFGPDGWLYVADSDMSELVLQPREHIHAQAPFKIYRFRPGNEGVPGR